MLPDASVTWTARPTWLDNPAYQENASQEWIDGHLRFQIAVPETGMKWLCTFPPTRMDRSEPFARITYRASHVAAIGGYSITAMSGNGDFPLLMSDRILSDGEWHTVTVPVPERLFQEFSGLAVQVQADAPNAFLEIREITSVQEAIPMMLADFIPYKTGTGASCVEFTMIPVVLQEFSANDKSGLEWARQFEWNDWFPTDSPVLICDVPFRLDENAALPGTSPNGKSEIFIPIPQESASEIHILLLAAMQGNDWGIFGGGKFEKVQDVDRFRFRIHYTDGTIDEAFPRNMQNGRFVLSHGIQAVAIPSDPSKKIQNLEMVKIFNQGTVGLAAVTLRTRGEPRFQDDICKDSTLLKIHSVLPPAGTKGMSVQLADRTPPQISSIQDDATRWFFMEPNRETVGNSLVDLTVNGAKIGPEFFQPVSSPDPHKKSWRVSLDSTQLLLHVVCLPDDESASVVFDVSLENTGSSSIKIDKFRFSIGPYLLSPVPEESWYLFPASVTACDNLPCQLIRRYGGYFPVQYMDSFAPHQRRGLTLRTEDQECTLKWYGLEKNESHLTMFVEFEPRDIDAGTTFRVPPIRLQITDGTPAKGLESYRNWLGTWYKPMVPRQSRFREAFNFRQCFLYSIDPLLDKATGKIDFAKAVRQAEEAFGGMDFFHLFDWGNCGENGRTYGRAGDASPWNFLPGGLEALTQELKKFKQQGIPVGFYIEGYLLGRRSLLKERCDQEGWQILDSDGKPSFWPGNIEAYICPYHPAWREIMIQTYTEKTKELGADGLYIDQFGFAGAPRDCYAANHEHAVPSYAVAAEKEMTILLRNAARAANPDGIIYTEEVPVDVTSQYQDGSFCYALTPHKMRTDLIPIHPFRFSVPDFKVFHILMCDQPMGPWATGVRLIFFNGDGIWLEGPVNSWFTTETLEEIRRCHAVLREHRDAFTSDHPHCLIETEQLGVYANHFPAENKDVYTLYNARSHTVRGKVLRVPHGDRKYIDAFTGRRIPVQRHDAFDELEYTLSPKGVGCIVVQ